jgi:hypothetical protein
LACVASSELSEVRMTYDPHKSTTEIRAGDKRRMNMRVLFISLVAVVIFFTVIYLFFFPKYPPV